MVKKEVQSLNGEHHRVFLAGMSQGAVIAQSTFLLYKEGRLGGLASFSGPFTFVVDWDKEVDLELKKQTKIMLQIGGSDPLVSIAERSYGIFG